MIFSFTNYCYNKRATLIYQVLPLLFFALFFTPFALKAQDKNPVELTLKAFRELDTTAADRRVVKAGEVYKKNCHHLKEEVVMGILDSLQLRAQNLKDKALECAIFVFRADYYSVNKGYNATSISYHQKAIDFAIAHQMPVETAIYIHKKGLYFFTFNHNTDACHYFLQAYDKFKEIGFNKIPNISTYILEQAKFYYALKDYTTAQPLLETALHYPIKNTRVHINVINTIGLIYRGNQQYHQALNYFDRALKMATSKKDSAWIGIATGNIGSVYFLRGMYDQAIPYLNADYNASLKYGQFANAAQTLLRISHIRLAGNQLTDAARQLDSVKILIAESQDDVLGLKVDLYDQKEALYQKTSKLDSALIYAKLFEAGRDSLALRNSVALIEGVKLKWETEKYRDQINQLKVISETDAFKRNAIIVILFLIMIIFILVFNRFRLDAIRDQERLSLHKKRVEEKLKTAAESLQHYTENLKQNNALVEKFKTEVEHLKTQSTDRAGAEHLEKLMQAHIMTDETWDDFKKLFTKVHGNFFLKLRNGFPNLTDTDMRLLALIKLGLNNREMANMLGITVEGIKKAKQRLRKKMQLPIDTDIEETIAGI